eukprot:scaffold92173_cov48-Attheya_sp.AAC.3
MCEMTSFSQYFFAIGSSPWFSKLLEWLPMHRYTAVVADGWVGVIIILLCARTSRIRSDAIETIAMDNRSKLNP